MIFNNSVKASTILASTKVLYGFKIREPLDIIDFEAPPINPLLDVEPLRTVVDNNNNLKNAEIIAGDNNNFKNGGNLGQNNVNVNFNQIDLEFIL